MSILEDIERDSFDNGSFSTELFIKKCKNLQQIYNITIKFIIYAHIYINKKSERSDLVNVYKKFCSDSAQTPERSLSTMLVTKGRQHFKYDKKRKFFEINNYGIEECKSLSSQIEGSKINRAQNMTTKDKKNSEQNIRHKCNNIIFYGPPGTGKTYKINEIKEGVKPENFVFVTFHQSYSYEDFIEGIRPVMYDEKNSTDKTPPKQNTIKNYGDGEEGTIATAKDIAYTIKPGIFKELCDRARKSTDETERFVIFIDEINRGNISKIFGELITLIEGSYRAPVDYDWNRWEYQKKEVGDEPAKKSKPMEVKLPYSGSQGELFSVPENVEIYGAMNTADRSLTLIDTALRRRFEFEPMWPDADFLRKNLPKEGLVKGINVPLMLERMNERIEALLDRDHTLGHAFFVPLEDIADEEKRFEKLQSIFKNKIIPLLEEYFFEDWEDIRRVLGDDQKNKNYQFIKENPSKDSDLFGKETAEKIANRLRKRYLRYDEKDNGNDPFQHPESFIGIYAPDKTKDSSSTSQENTDSNQ